MWLNKMPLQQLKKDVSKASPMYRQKSSLSVWTNQVISRRLDTQQNDTQHNNTQHNDTQQNDTQQNDTQHNNK
jgi:hypothetical protein